MRMEGIPQKVVVISENPGFGPCSEPGREVRQRLTVSSDGRAWLLAYRLEQGAGGVQHGRTVVRRVGEGAAEQLLWAVVSFLQDGDFRLPEADEGSWEMVVTNTQGRDFCFAGALCAGETAEGEDLSELIREVLDIQDLWAIDGNPGADFVDRVTVWYRRSRKNRAQDGALQYAERLRLDRRTETLTYSSHVGSGCASSCEYFMPGAVSNLLDGLDPDLLLECGREDDSQPPGEPGEAGEYEVTVDFRRRPRQGLKGLYDEDGLPECWPQLMEDARELICFYGFGELLDPDVYRRRRPRAGDYIYCSVTFGAGGNSYYYLTSDPGLGVGDRVWVPVGPRDRSVTATVDRVEYFAAGDAPFPPEQTKWIIEKCADEPPSEAGE